MIPKILASIFLIILFLLLSKSADLIVLNIREAGEKLKIRVFVLGIILGIMTNIPEMAIGINSALSGVPEMSFGNLMGGNIVIFTLILGISSILNRKIKTSKSSWPFLLTLICLFIPLILAFKGGLSKLDGLVMILSYIVMVYILYNKNKDLGVSKVKLINNKEIIKHIFLILIGVILLIIVSDLIVKTTLFILEGYNISPFIVGLLLYSIGTNLPELSIALRSFKRKTEELSFSNLIGSALGNILMLGILSFINPMKVEIDISYFFLILSAFSLFTLLYIFYRTDYLLSRKEGYALVLIYLIFIGSQITIQFSS